ncbi:3-dehydroquinate dehydratase (3-dehydroquinase) [Mucor velutinosus]|uniref:3-dehydroquinate dehydratase (3-dehydroquinase) n=1 Tax=Mucor velutinosus TaxID=708070 RepID=A0AAN7I278_9FUNG|nr:3-dehydroquinate dehydratase (3-dehydroquinase) [Mucor velutinosus]
MMNDNEQQDWTCPFKQTAVAAMPVDDSALLDIPNVSRSMQLNLPRSNSLDKLYYYSNKKNDTLKSLFPPSGYDDSDSDEDDNDNDQQVQLLRSFTVGSKHITHHREIWKCSTSTATSNSAHPDTTQASKKPPVLNHEIRISNEHGTIHAITTRGSLIVAGTSHYNIQSYNIKQVAESLFNTIEAVPGQPQEPTTGAIRCICFSAHANDMIWAGTDSGSLLAIGTQSNRVISKRAAMHSSAITFMLQHRNIELWTLDDSGCLNIWSTSPHGIDLAKATPQQFTVTKSPKTAVLSSTRSSTLWLSSGTCIDKFDSSTAMLVPVIPIPADLGELIQLFTLPFHHNLLFAVHLDGQITAWDETTFEQTQCVSVVACMDKLTAIVPVGDFYVWAGFRNGMVAVYDTRTEPWLVIKMWKAHKNAIAKFAVDACSISAFKPVISVDSLGHIAIWDGLLSEYWLEEQLVAHMADYCDFNELKTMICSWNMDAIKPDALTDTDREKIHEWLNGMADPDIIMVGIQEIVDLNSKTLTAKSFLSLNRKIETIEEADELLTHRYMLWHDYLTSVVDTNFGKNMYKIIKTDQMVGLFSCIFVKTKLEERIRHCDSNAVKTGFRLMNKSLHGNKGGIATRLIIDDTSVCFVNCHLAAGQSNVLTRNVDVDGILHSARFPVPASTTLDAFKPDSDGTSILDHDTCFLSGDLNYRIGMKRDQVLALLAAESHNKFEAWETLQQEDQLKKQLALNPMFRLFGFKEPPILFDPTYKYDQGSEVYDSSEKKRIPAWCDRILHRGPASMSNIYYRRHEVKASDHRPISAGFTIHAKTVCQNRLDQVKTRLTEEWQHSLEENLQSKKIQHITRYDLCDENEARYRLEKVDWDVGQVVVDLYRDKGDCLN